MRSGSIHPICSTRSPNSFTNTSDSTAEVAAMSCWLRHSAQIQTYVRFGRYSILVAHISSESVTSVIWYFQQ